MNVESFRVVGYPDAKHYTNPNSAVDMAVYSNEDIGFDSALSANDTYEFALPYPADIDMDNEAMIVHWIDFINISDETVSADDELTVRSLQILFSMLQVAFGTTNPMNALDATNQSEFKKTFDGPYVWSLNQVLGTDTIANGGLMYVSGETHVGTMLLRWVPLHPLDLPLPLFIALTDRSKLLTTDDLATWGTDPGLIQADTELVALRVWYTKRKLTASEKSIRGAAKFARLSS